MSRKRKLNRVVEVVGANGEKKRIVLPSSLSLKTFKRNQKTKHGARSVKVLYRTWLSKLG